MSEFEIKFLRARGIDIIMEQNNIIYLYIEKHR
jgi:hypothetical protein